MYKSTVPQVARIMILGPNRSGKSSFIQAVSQPGITPLEIDLPDPMQMEFGQIMVPPDLIVHLLTPVENAVPFDGINQIWKLTNREKGYLGHIILIDGSDPDHFPAARLLIETCQQQGSLPYVVALNHIDAMPADFEASQFRKDFHIPADIPLITCDARDQQSAEQVLMQLLYDVIDLQIQEEREQEALKSSLNN